MIFSLYFPILLSLSLSFLLHAFKKHIHSFFSLVAAISIDNNRKPHLKCQHHHAQVVLDSATVEQEAAEKPSDPPPLPVGFIDNCIDERRVGDNDDDDNNNEDEDDCWRRMEAAEARGNWRNAETKFPPPISSLNSNGQRNFVLLPVRKNGRLQLNRVRIKRPEIMHATRQDGRLRLFLVPDQRIQDDVDEEQELAEEIAEETEKEMLVESESESEEEDEVVKENRYDVQEEEDRINGGWNKYHSEGFRRCYEVLNHHHHLHVHGSYHNLLMFGVSIA